MNLFLIPISYFYRFVVAFRSFLYKHQIVKTYSFNVPIISIGNIVSGGTGKTPFINWLYKNLSGSYRVCVITRGYGRSTKKTVLVESSTDKYKISDVGDEPYMLIKQNKNIQMVVGDNKIKSIIWAINKLSPDIILLDDGFQSKYIKRDLDIVMMNGFMDKNYYRMIPWGWLREPIHSLNRTDFIIWTRRKNLAVEDLFHLYKNKIHQASETFCLIDENHEVFSPNKSINVVAVCGVGFPSSFINALGDFNIVIKYQYIVKDHYNYNDKDMRKIYTELKQGGASHIVTTAKDYYKLKEVNKKNIPIIVLEMNLNMRENTILNAIQKLVKQSVRENKK